MKNYDRQISLLSHNILTLLRANVFFKRNEG
jgi:hypothetical protein